MNKTELIASVAQKSDLTKKDAEKAVKAVFEAVSETLKKGDKVRARKAREGRNPRNNEVIKIPASKTPAFKAGKQLKDLVNKK